MLVFQIFLKQKAKSELFFIKYKKFLIEVFLEIEVSEIFKINFY